MLGLNMRVVACVGVIAGMGCGSASEPIPRAPVVVTVFNFLGDAVSVNAAGTAYGSIGANGSTVLTLPASTTAISWTVSPQRYSDGSTIPSDLATVTVPVRDADVVDINNVAGGQAYYTPSFWNQTADTVDVAIYDGTSVRCMVTLAPTTLGYSRLPYYRLTAASEFRYYGKRANCTGRYWFWDYAAISANYTAKTGAIRFVGTKTP